jgi:hypothetical protein
MKPFLRGNPVFRTAATVIGVAAAAYAAFAGVTWLRYGDGTRAAPGEEDALLDHFMPVCEVVERHHIDVAAPANVTFAAAKDQDLLRSRLVRAIFTARQVLLGGAPDDGSRPRPLLAQMQALGWGVLAEEPGREIVVGAVTQPWEANVVFTPLPPDQFRAFNEPGFVKIAWTLRADPLATTSSIFRTETRATATDPASRARFRRYWSLVSPGVILIRRLSLRPLKQEAERRARDARHAAAS